MSAFAVYLAQLPAFPARRHGGKRGRSAHLTHGLAERVLEALRDGPAEAQDLADRLNHPLDCIRYCLSRLKRAGRVCIHAEIPASRGHPIFVWRLA